MAKINTNWIFSIVISLVILGATLGLGLTYFASIENAQYSINGSIVKVSSTVDTTLLELMMFLVPLSIVIALIYKFLPRMKK